MPDSKEIQNLDSKLKKKVISAASFKKGTSFDTSKDILNIHKSLSTLTGHVRKSVIRLGILEKSTENISKKIASLKNISKTQSERISGTNIGAKLPGSSTSKVEDDISTITKSVVSIAEILSGRKKLLDDTAAYDRRKAEQDKRALVESKLEKRFEGLKKTAEAIIAPVKSILDKIINFFVTVFLGRVVFKLLEWFGDPKNAEKVTSIIRFLGDHWPKLLSLYLVFGTSFGRFAKGLLKVVLRGSFKLVALIAKLAAAKKVRGARGVAKFFGGGKGKLIANVAGTALAVGGTYAVAQGLKGDDGEKQKSQGFVGGGYVRPKFPAFGGGGLNFKGMMGGASLGAMFGPLGMLLGGAFGSGKPQEMFGGFVSGEKGVDKVPAMLSDGEFVMSRGAVAKYGVDTLEAMNAAGGGTNKPKIKSGSAYAQGGGYIGKSPDIREKPPKQTFIPKGNFDERSKTNVPFTKDPLDALRRFIEYKFGVNLNNKSSWGERGSSSKPRASTGSLITDPIGAIQRMSGMGSKVPSVSLPKIPSVSLPNIPKPLQNLQNKAQSAIGAVQSKLGFSNKPKSGEKGFFEEIREKLSGSGAATYRDAGSIYAKQMLGGIGGPVSERDLSKESQQELQKAIQRAKKRTGFQISRVESEISKLKSMGAKDGNPALERQKSFLKKLKSGGIRVEYADYADEKGNMSESAKNSKNILGQFWAYERDKKEGGGYRLEDKYDFDAFKKKVKDPKTGKMVERDLDQGELIRDVILGKGKTIQQKLQAAYLLNPFRGKGDVDMVLGGKRTAAESLGLSGSKTLLGGMLGISGKPKDKNTRALEAKRPWWDKMGMFGGASAQMARDKKAKQDFLKKNPSAKLYDKSQKNKEQAYKSRFARPKNSGVKPVKPPTSPKPKVVYAPPVAAKPKYRGGQRASTKTPNFSATNPSAGSAKAKTIGVRK